MSFGAFLGWDTGGGPTTNVDATARAEAAAAAAAAAEASKPPGAVVAPGDVTINAGNIWANNTAGNLTVPATPTDASMAAAGFALQSTAIIDEVVLSTTPLTGTAPAGAKVGRDIVLGVDYDVSGGNWRAIAATAATDANYIVGTGAPLASVGAAGDYYRQLDAAIGTFRVWGPRTATAWPATATLEVVPDPGNAQTYVFTRADSATTLPTAAETTATPRDGDIANGLLLDGRRIWWKHNGTAWVQTRIDPAAPTPVIPRVYVFTRADSATTLPTTAETAVTPVADDVANALLADGRRIWWRYAGTAWSQIRIDAAAPVITGDYIGASAAFATLPTTNPSKTAQNGDWAALTADVIGTGTALAPQFPRGVYLYNGTAYSFAFALDAVAAQLTTAQANDGTDTTFGAVSGQRLRDMTDTHVRGLFMGAAATFVTLPVSNPGRVAPLEGDWAVLSTNDVGTGTAQAPQFPRGLYRHNGTVYALATNLSASPALTTAQVISRTDTTFGVVSGQRVSEAIEAQVRGVLIGTSATYASLPTSNPGRATALVGDIAILRQDDVGTGTTAAPQWVRGVYALTPTGYALQYGLSTTRIGVFMGQGTTFATLPTTGFDGRNVSAGDWAFLSASDIGTGTALAPQYPRGIYRYGGASYVLLSEIPATYVLTTAEVTDRTSQVNGRVTGQRVAEAIEAQVRGLYMGRAATFATLPITNAGRTVIRDGDWAILTADEVGTGTTAIPQYPRGIYQSNGTAYTIAAPMDIIPAVTGVFIGSGSTFATLPTASPTKTVANGDWAALTADEIGTGTALAPQYPRGVYIHNGTNYAYAFSMSAAIQALTTAQATLRTDTTVGMVSGALLAAAIEAEVRGLFLGTGATFATLPTSNSGRATALNGDFALLTTDDIGTGTALAPQYPSGFYRYDGAAFTLLMSAADPTPLTNAQATTRTDTTGGLATGQRLAEASDAFARGVFMGGAGTFATLPTSNSGRNAQDDDWCVLTTDDVGTGTAALPQYARGIYRRSAGAYGLIYAIPVLPIALTAAQANDGLSTVTGLVTGQLLRGVTDTHVRGVFMGVAATFAGLPTSNAGRVVALDGDWAILSVDEIGTGTALAPQYPRGLYRTNGTVYTSVYPIPNPPQLTAAQVVSRTDTNFGTISGQRVAQAIEAEVRGVYLGAAATIATLPTSNAGRATALDGDIAILTTNEVGTGTVAAPQFPRGGYRYNGATFTLAWRLDDVPSVTGDYIGNAATFATLPTTNPTKTAANGDWAALTADVVGTGTAANPQYPRGVYVYNGTAYSFAFAMGGASAGGLYLGAASNYTGLPTTSAGRPAAVADDWAILTQDEIGTGTADVPQFVKGIYRHNGTLYQLSARFEHNHIVLHTGTPPTTPPMVTMPALAVDTTAGRVSHAWRPSTASWVPLPREAGVLIGSAGTYATLPTTSNQGRPVQVGDFAILTVATVGTGTAAAPQFPRGIYTHNGTSYLPLWTLEAPSINTGAYMGQAATFAALPVNNGFRPVAGGDWAILTVDNIGTGTAAAPQFPRGVYVMNGAYQFSAALDEFIPQVPLWAANTFVRANSTRHFNVGGTQVYGRRLADGNTAAGLNAAELDQWQYYGQAFTPAWGGGRTYMAGMRVTTTTGMELERITSGGSNATLDASELAQWRVITPQSGRFFETRVFPENFATNNGRFDALEGDYAFASAESPGAGTLANPALPRGFYRRVNGAWVFERSINHPQVIHHTGTPTGPEVLSQNAIAINTTTNRITHRWDVPTQAWVLLTATTTAFTVTPNNQTSGASLINGATTYQFANGTDVELQLGGVNALGRLTAATITNGTVQIVDERRARVRVFGVTAAATLNYSWGWAVRQVSGNAAVTPTQVEATSGPQGVAVTVPAGQTMTGFTVTNATVTGFTAAGLATIVPNNAGDIVFTATFATVAILDRASHVANAGTALTCGSIRLRMNTAANRGLQIQSATGANLAWTSMSNWEGGGSPMNTGTATTSGWQAISDFNFSAISQFQNSIIWDTTNNRRYLVFYTVQASFNNSPMMITEF